MKKLNTNQLLQIGLILALVVNCIIHFSSPSYRFYRENFDEVRKGVVEFERQVKMDFVPALLSIASNRSSSVEHLVISNSFSSSVSSDHTSLPLLCDTNSISRLMSLDYHFFQAGDRAGFELDGFYYYAGDLIYGSVIRSVSPTIVVTDDYQFIRPLMGKFSLQNTIKMTPSHSVPRGASNNVHNSSVVVPQKPDVYNPYMLSPSRGY